MTTRMQRWEPLTGVVFGVLLVTGGLMTSRGAEDELSASQLARFFETSGVRIRVGSALLLLSAALLLWFVACLRRRLEADGDGGHLATVVSTGGGTAAALVLVAATSMAGAVDRTDRPGSIDPAGAAGAWDLYSGLLGVALPVVLAVLVAATVVAARRSGWFDPVAIWLSWVLVAGLLALPIAWMFAAGAVLWIAAVSIAMTRRSTATGPATTRPRTA